MSTAHPLSHPKFELKHSAYTTDEKIRGRAPLTYFFPLFQKYGEWQTPKESTFSTSVLLDDPAPILVLKNGEAAAQQQFYVPTQSFCTLSIC